MFFVARMHFSPIGLYRIQRQSLLFVIRWQRGRGGMGMNIDKYSSTRDTVKVLYT